MVVVLLSVVDIPCSPPLDAISLHRLCVRVSSSFSSCSYSEGREKWGYSGVIVEIRERRGLVVGSGDPSVSGGAEVIQEWGRKSATCSGNKVSSFEKP